MHLFGPYCLRPWTIDDADSFVEHGATTEVAHHMREGFPYPCSRDQAVEFIEKFLGAEDPDTDIMAIAHDEIAIGSIGLFGGSGVHAHCVELAYWLGPSFWGRGIMKSAIAAMVDYGVTNRRYVRVFALPYSTNERSCRLLEKCGFSHEGTLHLSERKGDIFVDQELYAFTQQDAQPDAFGAG